MTGEFAKLAPNVREAVGLEVASALLFIDLGVDELPQIESEYEGRALQVIDRLAKARNGQALPQAGPWMSELARRAQDRLTMGTVVAESRRLCVTRTTARPLLPHPLGAQICRVRLRCSSSVRRAVLLGYDEPVAALRNVQMSIARFADATVAPEPDAFGRIAQNLGAIGFFVESVGQDADRPRGMFRYDPATGIFSADLGQLQGADTVTAPADDDFIAPRTVDIRLPARRGDNVESAARKTLEAAHAQAERLVQVAGDARAIEELERLLPRLANEADLLDNDLLKQNAARATQLLEQLKETHRREDAAELEQLLAPIRAPETPKPTAPMPVSEAAADNELRQIFVEEARDVLDSTVEQLKCCVRRAMTRRLYDVRRAFHTLKGSSRMVGFKTVGEGSWAFRAVFQFVLAQGARSERRFARFAEVHSGHSEWINRCARNPRLNRNPYVGALGAAGARRASSMRTQCRDANLPKFGRQRAGSVLTAAAKNRREH